jgi:hypothetical protein
VGDERFRPTEGRCDPHQFKPFNEIDGGIIAVHVKAEQTTKRAHLRSGNLMTGMGGQSRVTHIGHAGVGCERLSETLSGGALTFKANRQGP